MIKIEFELTKYADWKACQKWRHSESFLDDVTDDKWMFESGVKLWLVVNLADDEVFNLRKAAEKSGLTKVDAQFLSPQEVVERVVADELKNL